MEKKDRGTTLECYEIIYLPLFCITTRPDYRLLTMARQCEQKRREFSGSVSPKYHAASLMDSPGNGRNVINLIIQPARARFNARIVRVNSKNVIITRARAGPRR